MTLRSRIHLVRFRPILPLFVGALFVCGCGDDAAADDDTMVASSGTEAGADTDPADDSGGADSGQAQTIGVPFSFDDPFTPDNHFAHRIVIELPDGTTIYNTRDTAELESRFNASADGGSQVELRAMQLSMELEATVDGTVEHDRVWTVGLSAGQDLVELPGELELMPAAVGVPGATVSLKEEIESLGGQFFVESDGAASTGTVTLHNCPSDVIDLPKAPTVPATDGNRLLGSFRDLEIEGPDGLIATISADFAIGVLEIEGSWCD